MKIIGINDQHNASACLLENGVVRAALQEERVTRVKNEFCFPRHSIEWILRETGTAPHDVDAVAMSTHHITAPWTRESLVQWFAGLHRPQTYVRRALRQTPALSYVHRKRHQERLDAVAKAGLSVSKTSFVDHHTAHAAAAYHGSPWKEEPVLVLTADGEGDDLCASVRIGEKGQLHPPLATIDKSHSLGMLYSMVTFMMGMVPYEHEYKLMGLAPYAPESGAERSYRQYADLFEFTGPERLAWHRRKGVPNIFYSRRFLAKRLQFHRFDWIAAGLQRYTENFLLEWVRNAVAATGINLIALGGGVFMNVKLNKLIGELDEVEDMFVFPSCGDETNSMGAAFHLHALHREGQAKLPLVEAIGSLYWGPEPAPDDVDREVAALTSEGCSVSRHDDIEAVVAELLALGEIVARVKGPMEFGARALGNRSILADPTRYEAVRIVNEMVKNRDFWMPFAPSILAEDSDRYVANPKRLQAPYMMLAFDTTEHVDELPAAVHPSDRTARPQIVTREHNPDYHRLLELFRDRTNRGVVLNTSYNLHGYPITMSAADAVRVFRNSGLQHLALNQYLISKPSSKRAASARAEAVPAGLKH